MVKQLIPAIGVIFLLSSCTVFKSLNLPAGKPASPGSKQTATAPATQSKFIEEITVTPQLEQNRNEVKPGPQVMVNNTNTIAEETRHYTSNHVKKYEPEVVSSVQLKYASLLNTDVE